jgi:hypothetical protein
LTAGIFVGKIHLCFGSLLFSFRAFFGRIMTRQTLRRQVIDKRSRSDELMALGNPYC